MRNKVKFLALLMIVSNYVLANCPNLDADVATFMQKNQVPGVAIVIVNGKKKQFCNYGVTDLTTKNPVNEKTIFEIASISKTFTALAAAISDTNGMLELDDPITDYIVELKSNPSFKNITAKELLSHVSGIPYKLKDTSNDAAFLASLEDLTIPNQPLTYQYSNSGVSLVGLALEVLYFTDYQTVLNKLVLHKLSMKYTFVEVPKKYQKLLARAYSQDSQPIAYFSFGALVPAGGLKSNTLDMAKYLQLQINGSSNKKLAKALTLVHSNYYCRDDGVAEQLTWEYHILADLNKSLVSDTNTLDMHKIVTPCNLSQAGFIDKTGTTYGMSSYIAYLPQEKVGIVILTNKGQVADRVALGRKILSTYIK